MTIFNDLEEVLKQPNLEAFQRFIDEHLSQDADLFKKSWNSNEGPELLTLLGFLIGKYSEKNNPAPDSGKGMVLESEEESSKDLTPYINYILQKMTHELVGEPIHPAIRDKKYNLALLMLKFGKNIAVNGKDSQGNTLLALAIRSRNEALIEAVLALRPRLNEVCQSLQPLHEAVMSDLPQVVARLLKNRAQLDSYCGDARLPILHLAAKFGVAESMKELLRAPALLEKINEKENQDQTPLEMACHLMITQEDTKSYIKTIAVLLCNGADVPASDFCKELLIKHKIEILTEATAYLEDRKDLTLSFYRACHDKNNFLHTVLYTENQGLFQLGMFKYFSKEFGHAALMIERLLLADTKALESASKDEGLYAKFVDKYFATYGRDKRCDPTSKMRNEIAEGRANLKYVEAYIVDHPETRSARVWEDFKQEISPQEEQTSTLQFH